jgi:PAS domain S-box-containing protein
LEQPAKPLSGAEMHKTTVLSVALRAANLGVWEWDLRTNHFEYSDRAKAIFGFPVAEPVSRDDIIGVLHPDDHAMARKQALDGLDPSLTARAPYLYRIHRKTDGALRWIQAFGEPVFEQVEGALEPAAYIGTVQDVTDDVLARQQLAEQEARLRLAIETSGIAVWEVNLADQSVTHSPELNRLCGFPPEDRPTLEQLRSRYAPGERERLEREGAAARARGETKFVSEIQHVWPDGTHKWLLLKAQLAPGETSYDGRIIGALVDITEQKQREQQKELLVQEFKHRIKNSFAVMRSLVSQTLRGGEVPTEVSAKLLGRLQAMADAHDVVATGAGEGASLREVLERSIVAFTVGGDERIRVTGIDVDLNPGSALSFSLVFHELLTNAAKYGALSNDRGRIEVTIDVAPGNAERQPQLQVAWTESGGPELQQPDHSGFGTALLERAFASHEHSEVTREFRPEGMHLSLQVPLSEVQWDAHAADDQPAYG